MVEQMRRQTEDIIRYYGEIDRRVANAGTNGIVGLLELAKQMETAMSVVAPQELDWVVGEIRSLVERLVRIASQLEQLRALKLALMDESESEAPAR
jgi:hypothetical protein